MTSLSPPTDPPITKAHCIMLALLVARAENVVSKDTPVPLFKRIKANLADNTETFVAELRVSLTGCGTLNKAAARREGIALLARVHEIERLNR